ncbi:heavy metal translocating P-type ATPase [Lachnoclostridium pacaense]|uniref:heavy metal translocating P-type ATPase n=1 Tax=Enterocloster hominis (ex Hitch et al. 2024) TaxID=1917870 RepID=UPI00019784F9|nr:heavy metal translocating P-type ATPase [Lachnoclostridium pacaense]EEQ57284.1 heavy metal translocating P-type ATPase [Clostridiales bacterium 1_7_47FAA]MCC2876766.1 heavy metal translocating P-type ATPase [Lachnoclostridium pacaense]
MKFVIRHELRGRVRIHLYQKGMNLRQADLLQYHISSLPGVRSVKVYERTADAVILFDGSRSEILEGICRFSYENERLNEIVPKNSARALNQEYGEKLVQKLVVRAVTKSFFPMPLRAVYTVLHAVRYLIKGIRCLLKGSLEVEVLDATAIMVSIVRRDFDTAGSVMFLLGIGGLLEEWTHKKSVGDLARSMSLNISKVWQDVDGTEVLVPVSGIVEGDLVTVHMGNVIPLDGVVVSGEAMVNQASMTGESVPVKKENGMYVYAGTAIEEGEITLCVKKTAGSTRFERIVTMIEESEQLKSTAEGKAATLADALVPWSLGGTVLTWLLTRNTAKALSILMVDFSCALKLAMPLSVLSAMREAGAYHITVKGGKYMEAVAAADTIVFDKTGTLTKAKPQVADVVVFNGQDKDELLRIAACLEEHFPHSMANAVVNEAVKRGLVHQEMHSRVDYIVAHGIATYVGDERVVIGSHHFVFEDEGCRIPEDGKEAFEGLSTEYSHLYLAIGGMLAAAICIEDPLREEADAVISALHRQGISKIVMMTGDSGRTARAIAARVGVDEYYSEVLPEDKAGFVEAEKEKGRKVIMIGDGINDSPALSAADAGIAISEGAEIAREIADITISEDNLYQLVTLRAISRGLMDRIDRNYRCVIGFNLALILLGVGGVIAPATSALLHNTSTLAISLKSMTNLLD